MLQAQLMTGKLRKIEIKLQGPLVSETSVASALKTAVLKGLLTTTQGEAGAVNYVNTPYLAEQLGIEVVTRESPKSDIYTNLVTVVFETVAEGPRSISASVFSGNEPRLVDMDGFGESAAHSLPRAGAGALFPYRPHAPPSLPSFDPQASISTRAAT